MANIWKGLVLGMVGGVAGVLAMDYSSKALAKVLPQPGGDHEPKQHDISLSGRLYREGEGSTVALGRMLYHALTGKDPESEEAKNILSYLVHWGYGMKMGALYGGVRRSPDGPDLAGGAAYGLALWVAGDEIAVPLLGLAEGPQAYPAPTHVKALASHIVYGVTTALTTQALKSAFGED